MRSHLSLLSLHSIPTFLIAMQFSMRAWALSFSGLLLSQSTQAHSSSSYDASATLLDPEHNRLGAVASESSICSNIGIDMLKSGGNAADSLVATVFCVGVIGMYHSLFYPFSILFCERTLIRPLSRRWHRRRWVHARAHTGWHVREHRLQRESPRCSDRGHVQ